MFGTLCDNNHSPFYLTLSFQMWDAGSAWDSLQVSLVFMQGSVMPCIRKDSTTLHTAWDVSLPGPCSIRKPGVRRRLSLCGCTLDFKIVFGVLGSLASLCCKSQCLHFLSKGGPVDLQRCPTGSTSDLSATPHSHLIPRGLKPAFSVRDRRK